MKKIFALLLVLTLGLALVACGNSAEEQVADFHPETPEEFLETVLEDFNSRTEYRRRCEKYPDEEKVGEVLDVYISNIGTDELTLSGTLKNKKTDEVNALYGEGTIEGEKVVLVKPQTFMNLSGESIREFKSWYKTDDSKIIIIYDDVSLPVGKMRIRPKGSAGGHNGMKSIIYQLGSEDFPRIKIGVGSPQNPDFDLADYVLGKFTKAEVKELIQKAIDTADAVGEIIKNGIEKAMTKYN